MTVQQLLEDVEAKLLSGQTMAPEYIWALLELVKAAMAQKAS